MLGVMYGQATSYGASSHRSAAARSRVSIKFVNDMVLLKRRTGSLEPKPQGNGGGHGKLAGVARLTERRIKEKRDLTLAKSLSRPG